MNAQQYAAQNALGFEGDIHLKEYFVDLIAKHNIDTIVETGTYKGATTLQFSQMVSQVFTIESNTQYFVEANSKFVGKNIQNYLGSSDVLLPSVIDKARSSAFPILFLLDAHWLSNNPLLQELAAIAESGIQPVIAIHDFKVPNRPDLGFDSYGGQDYEWSWIAKSVEAIYGDDFTYFYNDKATGAKRGVIFIEPK